jgi:hypothetical protein
MDHPMTIRLQASVQTLVFVIMLAATLFGTAGRIDIIEFWVYIAIVAAASALSLTILDDDLMQERMRPGGRRVGLHLLPIIIFMFLHWAVAGIDRGRLHISDAVPRSLEVVALVLFACLDCDRLGHVRESLLFIGPANPVRTRPYGDQHWSLPLRPTSRLHGGAACRSD